MEKFSTNLSEAEIERLAILIEECGEVQQIACKILRHGYASFDPTKSIKISNRVLLAEEVGDLSFVIDLLTINKDISFTTAFNSKIVKGEKIKKYLHFNNL